MLHDVLVCLGPAAVALHVRQSPKADSWLAPRKLDPSITTIFVFGTLSKERIQDTHIKDGLLLQWL